MANDHVDASAALAAAFDSISDRVKRQIIEAAALANGRLITAATAGSMLEEALDRIDPDGVDVVVGHGPAGGWPTMDELKSRSEAMDKALRGEMTLDAFILAVSVLASVAKLAGGGL